MDTSLAHTQVEIKHWSLFLMVVLVSVISASAASSINNTLDGVFLSSLFWFCLYGAGGYCSYRLSVAGKFEKLSEDGVKVCAILGLMLFLYMLFTEMLVSALLILILWLQAATLFKIKTAREVYIALAVSFTLILFAASLTKSSFYLLYLVAYTLLTFCTLVLLQELWKRSEVGAELSILIQLTANNQFERKIAHFNFPWHLVGLSGIILVIAFMFYMAMPRFQALNINGFIDGGGSEYQNRDWEKDAQQSKDNKSSSQSTKNDADINDLNNETNQNEIAEGEKNSSSDLNSGIDSDSNYAYESDQGDASETFLKENASDESAKSNDKGGDTDVTRSDDKFLARKESKKALFGDEVFINKQYSKEGKFRNVIVMYMQASEPLYLRGKTFDTFSGYSWSNSDKEFEKLLLSYNLYEFNQLKKEDTRNHWIEVVEELSDVIYAASEKVAIEFPGTVIAQSKDGSIVAPQKLQKGTRYKIEYLPKKFNGRSLIDQPLVDTSSYLTLPDDFDNAIRELATKVSKGNASHFEQALALEQHLRNQYSYDLDSVFTSQGVTPLSDFLFETKKGHCEYFASSMAVMLRSIGIPSRLVTGYSATQYNPVTGYYEIRALHGHAWVEAYIEGAGWVNFEPTPAFYLPKPKEVKSTREEIEKYLEDMVESAKANNAESSELDLAQTFLEVIKDINLIARRITNAIASLTSSLLSYLQSHLAIILGGITMAVISYWFRQYLFEAFSIIKFRAPKFKRNKDVQSLYLHFEQWFKRRGLARDMSEDIKAYAERISCVYPDLGKQIEIITELAENSFYGKEGVTEGDINYGVNSMGEIVQQTRFDFNVQGIEKTIMQV